MNKEGTAARTTQDETTIPNLQGVTDENHEKGPQ